MDVFNIHSYLFCNNEQPVFMKCFLFFFCSFFSFFSIAQFDPSKEWFTLEDFFDLQLIQNKSVKSITVYKSDKKDDEVFSAETKFTAYFFSTKGELEESRKFVSLSGRIDTSVYEYKYNRSKLISRTEIQGPFSFRYHYSWINDSSFQEIKIDNRTLDTNYVHRVEVRKEEGLKKKYTYYNSVGRPMKTQWVTTNLLGKVIAKKESYARSASFVVDSFTCEVNQLIHRSKQNTIGVNKKTTWEFTYQEDYLDFIKEMKDGKVIRKFAILYNDLQLIKSIIQRDVSEKTISVYKVEYEYYTTQR